MLIRIQLSTGYVTDIDIGPKDTILDLKNKFYDSEGVHPSQQKILYMAQQLSNNKTIEELRLRAGTTLQLVVNMRGGN